MAKITYGAGGWAPAGQWWLQRVDQGQDFEIPLGAHVRAPGDGEVVSHAADGPFPSGFGDPYAQVRIDTGRFAGATYYIGHVNSDVPPVGMKFKEGDKLGQANNSLNAGRGWIELGLWPPGPDGNGARIAPLFSPIVVTPPFKPIGKGSRGPRVVRITKRLAYIHKRDGGAYLDRWYFKVKDPVVAAVRAFQKNHRLRVTGVIDSATAAEINATFERAWKKRGK